MLIGHVGVRSILLFLLTRELFIGIPHRNYAKMKF